MPQLRDAQTSELIAEGSPEEIARIAAGFAAGEVLFDDVGAVDPQGVSRFDPVVVRNAIDADTAALEAATATANGGPGPSKADLRAAAKARRDRAAAADARVPDAKARMDAARARVRARGGR